MNCFAFFYYGFLIACVFSDDVKLAIAAIVVLVLSIAGQWVYAPRMNTRLPKPRRYTTIDVNEGASTYIFQQGYNGVSIRAFDENGELIIRSGYDSFTTIQSALWVLKNKDQIERGGGRVLFTAEKLNEWEKRHKAKVDKLWLPNGSRTTKG